MEGKGREGKGGERREEEEKGPPRKNPGYGPADKLINPVEK